MLLARFVQGTDGPEFVFRMVVRVKEEVLIRVGRVFFLVYF